RYFSRVAPTRLSSDVACGSASMTTRCWFCLSSEARRLMEVMAVCFTVLLTRIQGNVVAWEAEPRNCGRLRRNRKTQAVRRHLHCERIAGPRPESLARSQYMGRPNRGEVKRSQFKEFNLRLTLPRMTSRAR